MLVANGADIKTRDSLCLTRLWSAHSQNEGDTMNDERMVRLLVDVDGNIEALCPFPLDRLDTPYVGCTSGRSGLSTCFWPGEIHGS